MHPPGGVGSGGHPDLSFSNLPSLLVNKGCRNGRRPEGNRAAAQRRALRRRQAGAGECLSPANHPERTDGTIGRLADPNGHPNHCCRRLPLLPGLCAAPSCTPPSCAPATRRSRRCEHVAMLHRLAPGDPLAPAPATSRRRAPGLAYAAATRLIPACAVTKQPGPHARSNAAPCRAPPTAWSSASSSSSRRTAPWCPPGTTSRSTRVRGMSGGLGPDSSCSSSCHPAGWSNLECGGASSGCIRACIAGGIVLALTTASPVQATAWSTLSARSPRSPLPRWRSPL